MDLRYGKKGKRRIEKLIRKHGLPADTVGVFDLNVDVPFIGTSVNGGNETGKALSGQFQVFTSGIENVCSFISHGGTVFIQKYCPLLRRRCIGEKCQWWYKTERTGDCAINWSGVNASNQLRARYTSRN